MARTIWMIPLLLMSFQWILSASKCNTATTPAKSQRMQDTKDCFNKGKTSYIVADDFYGIISATKHLNWTLREKDLCIIFLQKNSSKYQTLWKKWPQVEITPDSSQLYIPKDFITEDLRLYVLTGNCSNPELCRTLNISTQGICDAIKGYSEKSCNNSVFNDKYIINMTDVQNPLCINCDNPIKGPDEELQLNRSVESIIGNKVGEVDSSSAAKFVAEMGDFVSKMNGTSAELSVGDSVKGMIVRQTEPTAMQSVSFAYQSIETNIKIVEGAELLGKFSRSVTVTKEAFDKAVSSNLSLPFAAVLRFVNMTQDEKNSTVMGNEVVAIEMGAEIKNLTDTINITFKNMEYSGTPNCHSWNGEGDKPNWTDDGCQTLQDPNGGGIICSCSHLTFFAILLTPINETIPSADLKNLTTITQIGCGLSMFFLGVILFMHFILRKKKASQATIILIHLVVAMFLLNFAFLINNYVAQLKSFVACQLMAAFMHYFMLTTFSWFAAQALHLCLQLYTGGQVALQHYILRVSAPAWIIPGIFAAVIGCCGKYGQQTIYADNPKNNVDMCWIIDNNVHYIVNIGYYLVVFVFTFTTVIITLSWVFCLRRTKAADAQGSRNGKSILTIMGLCCQLGITWGFAFFAYGALRMPATYIFTILNSFQGFFLFIYYYNTSHGKEHNPAANSSSQSSSSISTLKSGLDTILNPYDNMQTQKQK